MSSVDIVVYVSYRYINWPILVIAHGNRHCGLVTAYNNWYNHSAMGVWILCNEVLKMLNQKTGTNARDKRCACKIHSLLLTSTNFQKTNRETDADPQNHILGKVSN